MSAAQQSGSLHDFLRFMGVLTSDVEQVATLGTEGQSKIRMVFKAAMSFMKKVFVLTFVFFILSVIFGVTLHLSWLVSLGTLALVSILAIIRSVVVKAGVKWEEIKGRFTGNEDSEVISKLLTFGLGSVLGVAFTGLVISLNPKWATIAYVPVFALFALAVNLSLRLTGARGALRWQKWLAGITRFLLVLLILSLILSLALPQAAQGFGEAWVGFDSWLRTRMKQAPVFLGEVFYYRAVNESLKERLEFASATNNELMHQLRLRDEQLGELTQGFELFRSETLLGLERNSKATAGVRAELQGLGSIRGSVSTMDSRLQQLSRNVSGLTGQINSLAEDVAQARQELPARLAEASGRMSSEVESVRSTQRSFENQLENVRGASFLLAQALRDNDTEKGGDKQRIRAASQDAAQRLSR